MIESIGSFGGGARGRRAPSDNHYIVVAPIVPPSLFKSTSFRYTCKRFRFRLITTDDWHTEYLIRPVFMRRATKNANVITFALGPSNASSLFVSSPSAIPSTVHHPNKNDCMLQGVDIRLKIYQTLLSLVTDFPTSHNKLLANVRTFVLCSLFSTFQPFRLHESPQDYSSGHDDTSARSCSAGCMIMTREGRIALFMVLAPQPEA